MNEVSWTMHKVKADQGSMVTSQQMGRKTPAPIIWVHQTGAGLDQYQTSQPIVPAF